MSFCSCCCKKQSTKCRMISVSVTGIILIIFGGMFFFLYRTIFDFAVKQQTEIRPGTAFYKQWVETTQKLYISFYFPNITNPQEFLNQKPGNFVKPIFEEKGPYTYRCLLIKDNIKPLGMKPEQIEYRQTFLQYFVPELSNGSEDDPITLVNVFALSLAPVLEHLLTLPIAEDIGELQKQGLYALANRLIDETNSTMLISHTAGEFLYGFQDPLYSAVVNSLNEFLNGTDYSHLLPFPDEFGFFKITNVSEGWHTFQAYTGDPEYELTNIITSFDNLTKLNYWYGDSCNMINGTDGTTRPPLSRREDLVYHFYPSACRATFVEYVRDVTLKGVPGWEYKPPKRMFKNPKESEYNKCFCEEDSEEAHCMHDGGQHLGNCLYGAPLFITAPHFLHGDGFYLNKVEGMKPDIEEHGSVFVYEVHTGAAIDVTKKLQFNIFMKPHPDIKISQQIEEVFAFPVMWVNGTYTLGDDEADLLYGLIIISEIVVIVVQVLILLTGVCLLVYVSWYYFCVFKKSGRLPTDEKTYEKSENRGSVHEFTNDAYTPEKREKDSEYATGL